MTAAVRHLYVHLPFCAHRCGYCDFVTVVGRRTEHAAYVHVLLRELELERGVLSDPLETVFLGGGTPTFTEPEPLRRLLAALPRAGEVTLEANPETVTPAIAKLLRDGGVTRVSLGAQTFRPRLLRMLERRATADVVRRAVHHLRDANFANISLDLIYGIPGQGPADLHRDLDDALALGPEHLSCYELEAKRGTRFTHRYGADLERERDAMEGYFARVVSRLTAAGYRWYETANFCRLDGGRDLRSRHNLGYWLAKDYLGLGVGAVSTMETVRWRNTPRMSLYQRALAHGEVPPRDIEPLGPSVRELERVMLALRLDEPLPLAGLEGVVDPAALTRVERLGLVGRNRSGDVDEVALTRRGRLVGDAVTAELLV